MENGVDSDLQQDYLPASPTRAQMAELVDALASGASVRMDVEVRVLSWAPLVKPKIQKLLVFLGFG